MYALVRNNEILLVQDNLPRSARRLDNSLKVLDLPTQNYLTQQATGWFQVVDAPPPTPTQPNYIQSKSLVLLEGIPTFVWSERPPTPEEALAFTAATNRTAIEASLVQDMTALQTILDSTNASINSNPAPAIKALARMLRRIGRHAIRQFDGTE